MKWINKRLQINEGSYGVLSIDAKVNNEHWSTEFTLTTYEYVDTGGKHGHCNFTLTPKSAIPFAEILYEFRELENIVEFEQEHKIRGKLFLEKHNKYIRLNIGTYSSCGGFVCLNKKQSIRLAGYVYYWIGQYLIGLKKTKIPAHIEKKLDVNDKL